MVIGISVTYEMLENHERKWGKKLNLGADIPISHVNPFSKKPVDDVPGDYSPKQKTKKKSKKSYYKNDRRLTLAKNNYAERF